MQSLRLVGFWVLGRKENERLGDGAKSQAQRYNVKRVLSKYEEIMRKIFIGPLHLKYWTDLEFEPIILHCAANKHGPENEEKRFAPVSFQSPKSKQNKSSLQKAESDQNLTIKSRL
jgi:hypothetical protein